MAVVEIVVVVFGFGEVLGLRVLMLLPSLSRSEYSETLTTMMMMMKVMVLTLSRVGLDYIDSCHNSMECLILLTNTGNKMTMIHCRLV